MAVRARSNGRGPGGSGTGVDLRHRFGFDAGAPGPEGRAGWYVAASFALVGALGLTLLG